MTTSYDTDVVAWANEQAHYIRTGSFDKLDLEHLAEEIEDVGKSEKRELASRMSVLLAHLLKWQFQPTKQSQSWQRTIKEQRKAIQLHIKSVPSLKTALTNADWIGAIYSDAVSIAINETGCDAFAEVCPWSMTEVLTDTWLPE
jgi:Domain of unknown function DUF29